MILWLYCYIYLFLFCLYGRFHRVYNSIIRLIRRLIIIIRLLLIRWGTLKTFQIMFFNVRIIQNLALFYLYIYYFYIITNYFKVILILLKSLCVFKIPYKFEYLIYLLNVRLIFMNRSLSFQHKNKKMLALLYQYIYVYL